jgi:hypothetical protein
LAAASKRPIKKRPALGAERLYRAFGLQFPIGDQFGVNAPQCLGQVTIPADWLMRGDKFLVNHVQNFGFADGEVYIEARFALEKLNYWGISKSETYCLGGFPLEWRSISIPLLTSEAILI